MIGIASGNSETFEFTITTLSGGTFRLDIKYHGGGDRNTTGAGIWPTMKKAQEVAEIIAQKQLSGAQISWDSVE